MYAQWFSISLTILRRRHLPPPDQLHETTINLEGLLLLKLRTMHRRQMSIDPILSVILFITIAASIAHFILVVDQYHYYMLVGS